MRRLMIGSGIAVGLLLGCGIEVSAQTASAAASPLALTLEDALTRAAASPTVADARAREAAAAATIGSREALGKPSVTVSSAYLRTNHVDEFGVPQSDGRVLVIFPDVPNNYQARAQLDVPLHTGGRVTDLVAAAQADGRAAAADRQVTGADVALEVTRAYWTLATARDRIDVLTRALQRTDASVSDTRARVDAGVLPPNDLLSMQARRARDSVALVKAQNAALVAEANLARAIGLDPGQAIVTTTPVAQETPGVAEVLAMSVADLVAAATRSRPERVALLARKDSLIATGSAARAASRPQIAAMAAVEPARPNTRYVPRVDTLHTSWDLGVNVRWAVLDGGRSRADAAAAAAQADALGYRLEDFDRRVAFEVRQRMSDLDSDRAAFAASGEAVAAAAEANRVVGERFGAGVATSTDVLDSEVALLDAELERSQLLAALRVDEALLLRTLGR